MVIKGKIEVRDGIRVRFSDDFGKYYSNLIYLKYKIITCTPAHGVHMTIINPKHEKSYGYEKTWDKYKNLIGDIVSVEYDNTDIRIGGFKNGFLNFWFSCKSKYKRNDIRLDVRNDLHCTLCSTKFNKGGVMGNYNGLPVFNKKVYVYGDGFYTNEIKTY